MTVLRCAFRSSAAVSVSFFCGHEELQRHKQIADDDKVADAVFRNHAEQIAKIAAYNGTGEGHHSHRHTLLHLNIAVFVEGPAGDHGRRNVGDQGQSNGIITAPAADAAQNRRLLPKPL